MVRKVKNETIATDISQLAPTLRRIAGSRLEDPELAEDVVQETLARLLAVRPRLERRTLASYAAVTAHNLAVSTIRERDVEARHAHRLLDPQTPSDPEEAALRSEEYRALVKALVKLSARERDALGAHEVSGASTSAVASGLSSTPGAVATLLARARARLRVEFLLAFRNLDLPTERCRPVLLALSSGDRRRQADLDAADHLLACPVCSSLSEPLLRRRRALAGFAPIALGKGAWSRLAGRHGVAQQATTLGAGAATALTAAVVVAAMLQNPDRPAQTRLVAGGQPLLSATAHLERLSGREVVGRGVQVQSVHADEGFWVGPTEKRRVWVQLSRRSESRFDVNIGERVSFKGILVPNKPGSVNEIGLTRKEGAPLLRAQGHHIQGQAVRVRD